MLPNPGHFKSLKKGIGTGAAPSVASSFFGKQSAEILSFEERDILLAKTNKRSK